MRSIRLLANVRAPAPVIVRLRIHGQRGAVGPRPLRSQSDPGNRSPIPVIAYEKGAAIAKKPMPGQSRYLKWPKKLSGLSREQLATLLDPTGG